MLLFHKYNLTKTHVWGPKLREKKHRIVHCDSNSKLLPTPTPGSL